MLPNSVSLTFNWKFGALVDDGGGKLGKTRDNVNKTTTRKFRPMIPAARVVATVPSQLSC